MSVAVPHVEVDVVDQEVAHGDDVLALVARGYGRAHGGVGALVDAVVEFGGPLRGAVVEVQGGVEGGGQVGVGEGLRQVGAHERVEVLVLLDVVVAEVDAAVAVVQLYAEFLAFGDADGYLEALDGALARQLYGLVHQVVAAVDGVVDHHGAAQLHAGVHHGQLAHVAEAAAVGALGGQLVDEGVRGHVDATAVGLYGVDLVDGELLEVGVVDHEGLSLVGVGYEGAVA